MPNTDTARGTALGFVSVDLSALVANWRLLRQQAGPACTVAAVVKADAYGLGMLPVAQALAAAGCDRFFVATPDEGQELASALAGSYPAVRIAVLSGPSPGLTRLGVVVPVLNDLHQIAEWRQTAPGRPAILHIDTGMARLGLSPGDVAQLAGHPGVPLAGVMSHLACADEPAHPMNAAQLSAFTQMAATLPAAPRSLAASCGIFLGPPFHFDMVRPGAALYGINPTPGSPNPMRQVVGIKAKILQVREIDAGRTVGYGATYSADRPRRVATLGVGYADGIPRSAGNRASAYIGSVEVPVIGRISMDLVTVDATAVPPRDVRPGLYADLVGPHYSVDDLARDSGTIGYEVLTRLSRRLPRHHRTTAP